MTLYPCSIGMILRWTSKALSTLQNSQGRVGWETAQHFPPTNVQVTCCGNYRARAFDALGGQVKRCLPYSFPNIAQVRNCAVLSTCNYEATCSSSPELKSATMNENLIQFAMQSIVLYLQQYPRSADTLEGVHQWWVQWPDIQESILVTDEALHRLQNVQQIESHTLGDREIWRLPREASDE